MLSLFIALIVYSGWYYTDRSNSIDIVSNNLEGKENKKINELNNNNYVIIEDSLDPKKVSSKVKNKDQESKQLALNKELDTPELETKNIENNHKPNLNNQIMPSSTNKVQELNVEIKTNEMSAKANERDPDNEMVLKATGNSWVEIEDLDGNVLMTRLMRPGETYVVPKINGLTFNTGNAGALSLSQGEEVISKLGEIGEIIKARPLNIKAFSKSTAYVE